MESSSSFICILTKWLQEENLHREMQNHKTKVAKKGQKHVPKHQNDLKKTREKIAT